MLRRMASAFMKTGISVSGRRMQRALDLLSRNSEAAQAAVLSDILSYAKDTAYGREHGFDTIDSPRRFQERVPINTYEDLRPYVDRHASGERDVLFPGKPMFYATTSGTTDKPKLIPITRKYHDECYNGLTKLWLYRMFEQNPGFMDGRDISMVGKTVEGRTPDGTTYGSFSGHMNAYMPEIIKRFRVVPFDVHDIDDYQAKYYAIMRIGLEQPIRWIVAANPSTLAELHRFATRHYDEIVRDIAGGTLKSDLDIAPPIRAAVERRLAPNPRRAAALEALAATHNEVLPKHYWPSLQVINTWKCGNSGLYLKQTGGYYPDATVIREFGYLATEARAGIVLDNDDETSVLAAHLLFFEFIKAADIDDPTPRIHLAHELEVGESYYIYITTPSGLYRYDINDIVRVEGYYNQFPRIRFMQKGRGVVSLTGEKVSESQYLTAMALTEERLDIDVPFHVAFADLDTSRYHLFVEPGEAAPEMDKTAISRELDVALARLNVEYDAKRRSNRLRPPMVHLLSPDAFLHYKQRALENGARDGQFKIAQLSVDNERFNMFMNLENEAEPRRATPRKEV